MKKFAFYEGGTHLSPTEKEVVNAGLSFVGKGDNAIKRDFKAAIDILRQKKVVTMGGANAVDKSDGYEYKTINGVTHRRKISNGK